MLVDVVVVPVGVVVLLAVVAAGIIVFPVFANLNCKFDKRVSKGCQKGVRSNCSECEERVSQSSAGSWLACDFWLGI